MLAVELRDEGEVTISGTEQELRELASWLLKAAVLGEANPPFAEHLRIERNDEET